MYLLGISGGILAGNQDGAAALIKDGEVIAAAEEERFLMVKHASGLLPLRAIKYCLKEAGITIRDVESVSFPGETYENFTEILGDYFDFHFGFAPPIKLVMHHNAHAAASYCAWNEDPALILTMDFSGDRISTYAAVGEKGNIREIYRVGKPNSLGIFYSMLTQYLGFEKDNDEFKVMGLSSYGNRDRFDFKDVLCVKDETYQLNYQKYMRHGSDPSKPAPSKQERLYANNLGLPQRGRLEDEEITTYHYDVAASGQRALEDVALRLVEGLTRGTGIRSLCLGGGVALNCVMNQRIWESGLVDKLYVPQHVSDAGLAMGSAFVHCLAKGIKPKPMTHCYLGPSFSDKEIQSVLDACRVKYERPNNLERRVAGDIAAGRIAGWFQGRMEFGPRALGNRSILADCRDAGMKDKINATVKFREPFRPFAPSALEEKAGDYFEHFTPSPYMTLTFNVKPEKRRIIPAITHVDGTARLQTVSRGTNPRYHALISEFDKLTGVPMVLNTSFNVKGQPIVCAPRSAIEMFFGTGMDVLAIGSFYVTK